MLKTDRIYVAGHRGMVGSACVRALDGAGYGTATIKKTGAVPVTVRAE